MPVAVVSTSRRDAVFAAVEAYDGQDSGGQSWTPIPRIRGSKLHAETQPAPAPGTWGEPTPMPPVLAQAALEGELRPWCGSSPPIRRTGWRLRWPGSEGRSWRATREFYWTAPGAEKPPASSINEAPRRLTTPNSDGRRKQGCYRRGAAGRLVPSDRLTACQAREGAFIQSVAALARGLMPAAPSPQRLAHPPTRRWILHPTCATHGRWQPLAPKDLG
jgi:hypothetical protein